MIHIMYGLPACGKTTFAMKMYESAKWLQYFKYVNLDEKDKIEFQNFPEYGRLVDFDIIIDGFFPSMENLYSRLSEYLKHSYGHCNKFTVYVFKPDIQKSLANDAKRGRANLATNCITKGIEPFDVEYFTSKFCERRWEEYFSLEVVNKKTEDYSDKDTNKLYSRWRYHEAIADGFVELDEYLEKKCPTITFLQYKKLMKLAECKERTSSDYYDEHETTSVQWSVSYKDINSICKEENETKNS